MVFFDLDGTLYRTHETCLPPLYPLCERHGITLTEEDEAYMLFTTVAALLSRVAPDMPQEQRTAFIDEYEQIIIEHIMAVGRLFDGVEEMLLRLHGAGIPIAICGMGSKAYIGAVLEKCGIKHLFNPILHRIEGKTKAQVLSSYLQSAKLAPEDCLMVGDSITDLTAARENGVPFVGVGYGYGAADLKDCGKLARDPYELAQTLYKRLGLA